MPRQEKGTRQRGLPARLKLDQKDSTTGSFPTKFRTSSDNRTGRYPVAFDDTKGISFNTDTVASTLVFPLVVNSGASPFEDLKLLEPDWFSGSYSGRISTRGYMRRGVTDVFVPARPGQETSPFRDCDHPELDGMIATETQQQNRFYKTGSELGDVGPGFQQPLWSKTKIEIPINLAANVTWGHASGSGLDNVMVYYDHQAKTYNRIGSSVRMDADFPLLGTWYGEKAFGFGPTYSTSTEQISKVAAGVVDGFGFPFHSRYHVPTTSSLLYHMSGVISEPFLLEKVTVEFSASIEDVEYATGKSLGPAYGTFFILNQRGGMTFAVPAKNLYPTVVPPTLAGMQRIEDGVGAVAQIGFTGLGLVDSSNTHTSGVLDIVTAMQFGTMSSQDAAVEAARKRELVFGEAARITNGYTTGFSVMSGTVKSPSKATAFTGIIAMPNEYAGAAIPALWLRNNYGGRSGTAQVSGRSWKSLIPSAQQVSSSATFFIADQIWENNPYVLMPSDKLIIGWQSPFITDYNVATWTTGLAGKMTLHAGSYKLTLYGSHLRVGPDGELTEYHDTLNQLVSSNAIHEIIG